MAQIQSQIPQMGRFRLKIGPKGPNPGPGPNKMAQIAQRGQFRLEIGTRPPLNGPNSGPEPLKIAQIQFQIPQNGLI